MGKEILKCQKCFEYTMQEYHCGMETKSIKPAKYSPEDRWQRYRLRYKKEVLGTSKIV